MMKKYILSLIFVMAIIPFAFAGIEIVGVTSNTSDSSKVINLVPIPSTFNNNTGSVNHSSSTDTWITNEGVMDNVVDLYATLDGRYSLISDVLWEVVGDYLQPKTPRDINVLGGNITNISQLFGTDLNISNSGWFGNDIEAVDKITAGGILTGDNLKINANSKQILLDADGIGQTLGKAFIAFPTTTTLPDTAGSLASLSGTHTWTKTNSFSATATPSISLAQRIEHFGDADTFIDFFTNEIRLTLGGLQLLTLLGNTLTVDGDLNVTGNLEVAGNISGSPIYFNCGENSNLDNNAAEWSCGGNGETGQFIYLWENTTIKGIALDCNTGTGTAVVRIDTMSGGDTGCNITSTGTNDVNSCNNDLNGGDWIQPYTVSDTGHSQCVTTMRLVTR